MFSGFMVDTWLVGTVVAVVAGAVGLFTVIRGSSFAAHAIPNAAFAGAAGAVVVGASTLLGLGVFGVVGAVAIAWLSRRAREDVATALAVVVMLGLGSLFLSFTTEPADEVFSLLFGEVLGVGANELLPTALLGFVALIAVALLARPLLLTSVDPALAEARGTAKGWIDLGFLLVVAVVTTVAVPVVGALLMFALMIGPAAAARWCTDRPARALALAIVFALLAVWAAIAFSYLTNWPIGFWVGTFGLVLYGAARAWSVLRTRRRVAAP